MANQAQELASFPGIRISTEGKNEQLQFSVEGRVFLVAQFDCAYACGYDSTSKKQLYPKISKGGNPMKTMKNHSHLMFLVVRVCAIALLAACAIPAAHAQLYWDTNGATPGAGATPTGTWGTDSFWSTASVGDIATGAYTPGSAVVFAAGDPQDAVNPYTVTLNGTQSASGITFQSPGAATISGGTSLQIGSGGVTATTNATIGSATALTASQTWTIANGTTQTQNSGVSGAFVLTKAGAGTLNFTSSTQSTFSSLVINEGIVSVTGTGVIGNNVHVTLANTAGASLTYVSPSSSKGIASLSGGGASGGNVNNGGNTLLLYGTATTSYAGAISGAGGVTIRQASNQTLSGSSTFAGQVQVRGGGNLTFTSVGNVNGGASSLGAPTSSSGGTIQLGQASTSENGTLTYTGSGHSTDRIINLQGSGGGGALLANGSGALNWTGNLTSASGAKTFTLGGTSTLNNTFAGVIQGVDTSVTKTGVGKWILSGTNTYAGPTTVSTGTLLINGSTAAGSAVTVNGGTLGGSGTIGGAVTVNSGGTLAPGSSIQSLASGALALNTGSTFGYEVDSGVATSVGADLQVVNGTLDLAGTVTLTLSNLSVGTFADNTKFTLINYNGAWNNGLFTYNAILLNDGDTFTFNGQDWIIDYNASSGGENFNGEYLPSSSFVNITAVPEPSTLVLAAFGLATGGLIRRRKVG